MIMLRLAVILSVFAFCIVGAGAEPGASPFPSGQLQSLSVPVDDVFWVGRCPRLCVEWYDGCNLCTCGKGRIDVCSRMLCRWRRPARCLRWGF